jgi:hypothetical protein
MELGYDAWNEVRTVTKELLTAGSSLDKNEELKKA